MNDSNTVPPSPPHLKHKNQVRKIESFIKRTVSWNDRKFSVFLAVQVEKLLKNLPLVCRQRASCLYAFSRDKLTIHLTAVYLRKREVIFVRLKTVLWFQNSQARAAGLYKFNLLWVCYFVPLYHTHYILTLSEARARKHTHPHTSTRTQARTNARTHTQACTHFHPWTFSCIQIWNRTGHAWESSTRKINSFNTKNNY